MIAERRPPPVWTPQEHRGLVGARTSGGHAYTYYTRAVPLIPNEILDCAVYLYPSVDAANEGRSAGGSGFLVGVRFDGHPVASTYAVTNAHVVAQGNPVVRLNTTEGRHEALDLPDEAWIRHPDGDDVCIAPLGLDPSLHFRLIGLDQFMRRPSEPDGRQDWDKMQVGQEVLLVGRFVNHEGRQRNLPTARFGHISALPIEPIRTEQGILQESFLADVRSLSGYSGSPVFAYRSLPSKDLQTEEQAIGSLWTRGLELRFLGVDCGHLPTLAKVRDADRHTWTEPPLWAEQNSGMAVVVPAWRVRQLFEMEEVVEMRRETENAWLEEHGNDDPIVADSLDDDAEFERFKQLTKKLVNVPKKELDQKRDEES